MDINENYNDSVNLVQEHYKKLLSEQQKNKENQDKLRKAEALAKASIKGYGSHDLKGTRNKKNITLSTFQKYVLVLLMVGALITIPNLGKITREVDYNRQMSYMNEVMPINAMDADCSYSLGEYNEIILTGSNEDIKLLNETLKSKGFSEESIMVLMYNWAGTKGLDKMTRAVFNRSATQYLADYCGGNEPYSNELFDNAIKTLKNVAQDNLTETSKAIKEFNIEQSRGM